MEKSKFIQTFNEENKRNYFMRRNHILRRNYQDGEESRSKSIHFKECIDQNSMSDLNQKAKIVNKVKNDEKTWKEKKRQIWVF